jgi:uncharacterized SAM-binding protein YcdF (DUF218 family)
MMRLRWAFGLLLLIAVLAAAAATARLFVWPETSGVSRADAVVVFGAAVDERLMKGVELVDEGVAPVLVLSAPEEPALCSDRGRVRVICFEPDPFNTRGEAQAIGRLATEEGWDSLVLVTSTYHVTRARLLLDRCFGGRLEVVAAKPSEGLGEKIGNILHEWGGLGDALTVARGC